jgi:hypothetical protein
MANYYYLITALPPLVLGSLPELSFKELRKMLALNLTQEDKLLVEHLLRPIDLYNIRALWLALPLDERGNLSAKELEEELLVQQSLPAYLIDYLQKYESTSDRLRYFSSLFASLYRETAHLKGFLLKYYQFQRDLRLVLTALRAKQFGKDIVRELQFEDPTDLLVAEILSQKDAPEYVPPEEFEVLKTLFIDNGADPHKLHRAILRYQFNKIEEMEENQNFSMDLVLSYIVRFMLAESFAFDGELKKYE